MKTIDRFDIAMYRQSCNDIKGALSLARSAALQQVVNILKRTEGNVFNLTVDDDTDEDECLKGEIYHNADEFDTYFIKQIKLKYDSDVVLVDMAGDEYYIYQLNITMDEVLDAMVREMENTLQTK